MTRLHFLFLGLFIVHSNILVAGFTAILLSELLTGLFFTWMYATFNSVAGRAAFWFLCCTPAQIESFRFCLLRIQTEFCTQLLTIIGSEALHKKWRFPLRRISSMWPNPQFLPDLVTFNEEIINEKLHFLFFVQWGFHDIFCITKLYWVFTIIADTCLNYFFI